MKLSEKIKSPIVIVYNDSDWECLYVNGKAVAQASEIQRNILINFCVDYASKPAYVISDYEQLEIEGEYPENLDDIPEYQSIKE